MGEILLFLWQEGSTGSEMAVPRQNVFTYVYGSSLPTFLPTALRLPPLIRCLTLTTFFHLHKSGSSPLISCPVSSVRCLSLLFVRFRADTSTDRKQRAPLVIAAIVAGSGLFIGLKWRAVMARSDAAKRANEYTVAPGRSGEFSVSS